MHLLRAFKQKPVHAILAALGIFFLTPMIQLLNTPLAFEIWYNTFVANPLNAFLYILFSITFGLYISLYLDCKNKCVDCKNSAGGEGFLGALMGLVLGVCPACFSFLTVLLPLSGSIFLTAFAPFLTALSIVIMFYSINQLGGFKA
ncbi:hypothetical protein HZC07_03735 [Candidatus Micrarchaeota archaeon]|nr:hypothetical protein [Candidatus Micrarchaeota archaeon]